MGYTEPDPRDDLSGQDVARKLLILARQSGLKLDIGQVRVDSLVPRQLSGGPFSQRFFTEFARYDARMAERLEADPRLLRESRLPWWSKPVLVAMTVYAVFILGGKTPSFVYAQF